MKKSFLFASALGFAATFWFFRLPFSYGHRLKGFVIALFYNDNGDIVVKLSHHKQDYLISRGRNLGIDLKKLKTKLIGKPVYIWITHPKWPFDNSPYITRLICDHELVYTKW
ncbi:MAG TPA: hypothetical protein ENH02_07245 [Bacteroidetes bacterium]|nr:hypothetical protein [Bacteroidota bacterium]